MAYCLPKFYRERRTVLFDDHEKLDQMGVFYQPDVYHLANVLIRQARQNFVVDVGCGSAAKALAAAKYVIGIETASNVARLNNKFPAVDQCDNDWASLVPNAKVAVNSHKWIEADLEKQASWIDSIPPQSVVVCADVVEHLLEPDNLLNALSKLANYKRCTLVISTPDRHLAATNKNGPPGNKKHVREWTLKEFRQLLQQFSIPVTLAFHTRNHDQPNSRQSTITVIA